MTTCTQSYWLHVLLVYRCSIFYNIDLRIADIHPHSFVKTAFFGNDILQSVSDLTEMANLQLKWLLFNLSPSTPHS